MTSDVATEQPKRAFYEVWYVQELLYFPVFVGWLLITISQIDDLLPEQLTDLPNFGFYIAVPIGVLASVIFALLAMAGKKLPDSRARQTVAVGLAGFYILTLVIPPALGLLGNRGSTPPIVETLTPLPETLVATQRSGLATLLAPVPLSNTQQTQIAAYVDEQGFMTQDDLRTLVPSLGLSDEQLEKIVPTLAAMLSATGVPSPECYLQLLYDSIAVRRSPEDQGNYNRLGYLKKPETQSIRAFYRSYGSINEDLWWMIEFQTPDGEVLDGWVASFVVEEQDPVACLQLPHARGSYGSSGGQ